MAHTECLGEFIERNDCGIPPPAFKTAQVLLTEPGACFYLFLSETLFPPQASEVASDQLAHIHAPLVAIYTL